MAKNELLKGGILVALFYWIWFSSAAHSKERVILLITLVSTPVIVLAARLLALNLPFRPRPIQNEDLNFTLPVGMSEKAAGAWSSSSFPSDHAVLYFAFAIGIFAASKRFGLAAIIYTLLFIAMPRVYAGYHYPTDILAGSVIGGILILSSIRLFTNSSIPRRINAWSEENAGAFYTVFFLITFQIATLFNQLRQMTWVLYRAVMA